MRAFAALGGLLLVLSGPARAEPTSHIRIDRHSIRYDVQPDLTFTMTRTDDTTLLTSRGVQMAGSSAMGYSPDRQRVSVVQAWVDQPDGTRVVVPAASMFNRVAQAPDNTPGFVNAMVRAVVFPQLKEGSRTHVVWKLTQTTPAMYGFNVQHLVPLEFDSGPLTIAINLPAELGFAWKARGGFEVTDVVGGNFRHIVAYLPGHARAEPEAAMVPVSDVAPGFAATTLPNYEAIGAITARAAAGRAGVTPDIQALADRIALDRTGIAAARAIYEWVTENIRYVAVYLNMEDGWVPHAAPEVLKAGYGDCKDYSVLMQALLAARGIKSEITLVRWDETSVDPLLWGVVFNHAIIYLPEFDRYLNPTRRYAPFDAADPTLADRLVVRLGLDGIMARTPAFTAAQNRYRMTSRLQLDLAGTVIGTAGFEMSTSAEPAIRQALAGAASPASLAAQFLRMTPEAGFGALTGSDPRDLSQPLQLHAEWTSPHAVTVQDGLLVLLVPAGLDLARPAQLSGVLRRTGTAPRRQPAFLTARDWGWSSVIDLPPGRFVAHLPDDVAVSNQVGSYHAHYVAGLDQIKVERRLVIHTNVIAPEDFAALEMVLYAAQIDARAAMTLTPNGG
ncbi:MAG: DUF3857 and transglutaminase domain-containing protein [Acetobacteraceae bacterium]|nr:DUF3857 and transglutaminase domain-containing protein [Acetobacteraceae bacterium]